MPWGNNSGPQQEHKRVTNHDKFRTQNKLFSLVSLNSFEVSTVSLLILLLPFPKCLVPIRRLLILIYTLSSHDDSDVINGKYENL